MTPTEMLKEEHRYIERMLAVMERAARKLGSGKRVPSSVFSEAIHFIRTFADGCHHHKEEVLLFPALVEKGFPAQAGPIAVMLNEHDLGRAEIRGMNDALQRYAAGDSDAGQSLITHTNNFVALLRNHIMKEDNVLFVMADQHLSTQEQSRLSIDFETAERTGEACMLKKDLIALLERMEREAFTEATTTP